MAYTTAELITNAYYISQVRSRGLDEVSGQELADGLRMLNGLLAIKSAHSRLIPYYTKYEFDAVEGEEKYFIPGLILCETFTFNIGPVRYEMQNVNRRRYQGSARVDGIKSLPYNWNLERTKGGSDLYVYFLPAADYPMIIWGKFGFENVEFNEDLLLTFEEYYIDYLRYRLAKRICVEYGISFTRDAQSELAELESIMTDVSPPDLTLQKMTVFRSQSPLNWGDVNLGHGWRPGT